MSKALQMQQDLEDKKNEIIIDSLDNVGGLRLPKVLKNVI
jgi:hypothetical protein